MARPRRNRNDDPPQEGAPEWMLTYSDLVTLLLTFFIMLFSMSVVDKQKYEEVANSLRSAFTRMGSGNVLGANTGVTPVKVYDDPSSSDSNSRFDEQDPIQKGNNEDKENELEAAKDQLEKAINDMKLQEYVSLNEEEDSLILRFDSYVLFDLGSADIRSDGKNVLDKLSVMLIELDNDIIIQGHTDNIPINTELYPTNWELSTKRATNVVLYLVNKCGLNPVKLTASGNGEFKPIAANNTDAGRQKNRRIDIVIKK